MWKLLPGTCVSNVNITNNKIKLGVSQAMAIYDFNLWLRFPTTQIWWNSKASIRIEKMCSLFEVYGKHIGVAWSVVNNNTGNISYRRARHYTLLVRFAARLQYTVMLAVMAIPQIKSIFIQCECECLFDSNTMFTPKNKNLTRNWQNAKALHDRAYECSMLCLKLFMLLKKKKLLRCYRSCNWMNDVFKRIGWKLEREKKNMRYQIKTTMWHFDLSFVTFNFHIKLKLFQIYDRSMLSENIS